LPTSITDGWIPANTPDPSRPSSPTGGNHPADEFWARRAGTFSREKRLDWAANCNRASLPSSGRIPEPLEAGTDSTIDNQPRISGSMERRTPNHRNRSRATGMASNQMRRTTVPKPAESESMTLTKRSPPDMITVQLYHISPFSGNAGVNTRGREGPGPIGYDIPSALGHARPTALAPLPHPVTTSGRSAPGHCNPAQDEVKSRLQPRRP